MALYDRAAILAAHPIEDVVASAGVELHPKGSYLTGCCPIHGESNPSMSVRPAAGRFTCFACGATGDAIQFVMDLRGIGFRQACDYLTGGRAPTSAAATAARPIPAAARDLGQTPEDVIAHMNDAAWAFYTGSARRKLAIDYLATRGIDVTALEAGAGHRVVGHTGGDHWALTRQLKHLGYTDTQLIDSGWSALSKNRVPYDRFRDRLILPITDSQGRVRGVYGRATDPNAEKKHRHLNTKETKLYSKNSTIYRPSHHHLDDAATVVVCEGQVDALAVAARAAQHRVHHMFGPVGLGTASISIRQVVLVLDLHPKPVCIALDSDERGAHGAVTVAAALIQAGREVISASLPDGDDPASWLVKQANGLHAFDRNGCLRSPRDGNSPSPVGQLVARVALSRYLTLAANAPPDAELRRAAENARDLILQFAASQPTADARTRYIDSATREIAASQLRNHEAAAKWLTANLAAAGCPSLGACPLDTRGHSLAAR
jgi:DNA primase